MHGLSLETRYQILRAAERLALARPRAEPGSRRLALTAADAAVLRALLFDFHNARSGRCDPGMRHLARRARVGLGTVPAAVARLEAAGFVRIMRRTLRVLGRAVRWTHAYFFPAAAPVRSLPQNLPLEKKQAREQAPARQASPAEVAEAQAALARARARLGASGVTPGQTRV